MTSGRWFGDPQQPLLGWLSAPAEGLGTAGVLVLPDVGAQYWSAHRTLRVMAERLARGGHTVLRLDYDGTGDSAGDQWEPDRVAAWRAGVAHGAGELRELGCERLTVVGVRLGGMLALLEGAGVGADEVVAWEPAVSGKRSARALRLLGEPIPGEAGLTSGGVVFSAETVAELSVLDVLGTREPPAERTLLLGDVPARVVAHLRDLGSDVEHARPPGRELALDRATEVAEVAEPVVDAVVAWVAEAPGGHPDPAPGRPAAEVRWAGVRLTECVETLRGMVVVRTEPPARRPDAATLVFLNSGSGTHVGPGRAWVEYAREVAAAGHRAVRADWPGWGESPDGGHAPGRPYDAHAEQDTVALVEALHDEGHERIVLVGLCASAWIALRVARAPGRPPIAGVIALNPQLYWRQGDPVLTMPETHVERTSVREREERGRRLWPVLDLLGHRPWAGSWLDELAASGVPVLALFAQGDEGLVFLRTRLARRLRRHGRRGAFRVQEVADIDHGMQRAWLRPRIVQAILGELERVG